jgi:hypothetical protein
MNEQAIELIREVAAKIGVNTEHLWAALMKQAFMYGVWCAVMAVAAGSVAAWFHQKARRKIGVGEWGEDIWFAVIGVDILAGCTVVCCVFEAITHLANPEFAALKFLLGR